MKRNSKSEIAPTLRTAAARMGISLDELKTIRDQGADGFLGSGRVDVALVRRWLSRRMQKAPVKKPAVKPGNSESEPAGLAASLTRLAQEERRLFGLLQTAVGTGQELQARKSWLSCCEMLRRADSNLEDSRKSSGDFVERQLVEDLVEAFGRCVSQSTSGLIHKVLTGFRTLPETEQAGAGLTSARNWIRDAATIAASTPPHPAPSWLTDAFLKGASNGLAIGPGDNERRLSAIRDLLDTALGLDPEESPL